MGDYYSDLDDLIKKLEECKENGHGPICGPQAIYLLALEIKKIKELNPRESDGSLYLYDFE